WLSDAFIVKNHHTFPRRPLISFTRRADQFSARRGHSSGCGRHKRKSAINEDGDAGRAFT
ncbi:hypothetical protein P0D88_54375, partial [Paraburkholderia sp. RL18-103-BIB-C]|uniref:hypothetical protein n=1 Tax=Paraburkholderia sp. RL18-103-BIB-C TaxID=3031637 RepID=UPI0038BC273C